VLAIPSRLVIASRGRKAAGAGCRNATPAATADVWIGLFGFKEVRTGAGIAAGVVEVAAFWLWRARACSRPATATADGAG